MSPIDGDLARGTLIAFASDPKSTALDGPTGSAQSLHGSVPRYLFDAGVTIDTVMSRVRNDVWEKTGHHQLPWVNTSLIGEYELNPQPAPGPTAESAKPVAAQANPADPRQAQENLLWESAQHSNLSADYQAYLSAFPDGVFAQMAKNKIASMESARTSAPTPAPQTLAMVEPSGSKDDAVKENVATADTERALNLGAAGEKEVQQRLGALDLYTGPRTGALDAGNPVCSRGMAEEEWLRADIIPRFRATCGATSGQRDRVSEEPRRSAYEPAGRY